MAKLGKVFGFVPTFCGFFLKKRMVQIPFHISFNKEDGLYWITSISQELDFEVLVTDPLYHAPIVFYRCYLYPGVNYWFTDSTNSQPQIPTLRFYVTDKISGNKWELFQNLSLETYQKRIDAHLDDTYKSSDSFFYFNSNLYKNSEDYIFPEDKSGWFIDLGANLGSYTLLALALGFKKCLLVEPTDFLAKSLRNTFSKFTEVFIEQAAVTNIDHTHVTFKNYYQDHLSLSNVGTGANLVLMEPENDQLCSVPNYRLLNLLEKYNVDKISLLKIDIEGQEQDVIFGLEDSIWDITHRIHLEIHVLYGLDSQKISDYVLSKGYHILEREDRGTHVELLFEKVKHESLKDDMGLIVDQSVEMKKFRILCDGGLGNRIFGLVGGLLLSDMLGYTPVVHWPENNYCRCKLDDLFIPDFEFDNRGINKIYDDFPDYLYLIHVNQLDRKINMTQITDDIHSVPKETTRNIIYYNSSIPNFFSRKDIVEKLSSLQIKKEIINQLFYFLEQRDLKEKLFDGIHIRKTDFSENIDVDYFLKYVENSSKKTFICSDDQETEKKFFNLPNVFIFDKTNYPTKLITSNTWTDPTLDTEGRWMNFNVDRSSQSVIEGFIDLLILSRSEIIETSNTSTFLKLAKIYSDINLEEQYSISVQDEYSNKSLNRVKRKKRIHISSCCFGKDLQTHHINLPEQIQSVDYEITSSFYNDNNFPLRNNSLHPRMKGKIPKMLEWVNIEADYYVWLDYAIEIKTNNFYEIIQDLEDYDICLFKHKQRNSIQEELEFIESGLEKEDKYITSKYSNENMNVQVRNYLEDSSFIDNKLFEMGFFIYSKNLIKNRDYNLMTDWFLHNAFYSVQDQLSFPYLLWKHNIRYKIFNTGDVHNNLYTWYNWNKLM
jgi:FkbM family methyltransferase